MKLRNKFFAGLIATVLLLSLTVGTAFASTDQLPFDYPNEADAPTNNDVWVVLFGGTAATPLTDDVELRDSIESVDVVISGNATFSAEIVANGPGPWTPTSYPDQEVDGELILNMPYIMKDAGYCEVIVNLQGKSEGALSVKRIDFKDAAGSVVLSHGEASEAAEAAPKTGVVSTALFLGLGAAVFGTGAVVLKKKED
jgi:LPXTG-motif cell wall-anchored protein